MSYPTEYQTLFSKGLVDEGYPVDRLCVQLPNGWFGIHSIINRVSDQLKDLYDYDEEMVPSVSTNQIFSKVPADLQGDAAEIVFKITHTGLKELEQPFFMSTRPELVIPQIEMNYARSYKHLPIRRISGGFRYVESDAKESYALITDTEQSAKDVVGIFFKEDEYEEEIKRVLDVLHSVLKDECHLSTFSVRKDNKVMVFACFPNGTVLEIATVRLYGQKLAEALEFTVLGPDNKQAPPFVFGVSIGSKAFAATVVAHTEGGKVVLPKANTRAHAVFYGEKKPNVGAGIRVDVVRKEFTKERFDSAIEMGVVFAIVKEGDNMKVMMEGGKEFLCKEEELHNKLEEELVKRDEELKKKEQKTFEERFKETVVVSDKEEDIGEKKVLGVLLENQTDIKMPEVKKYAVAKLLVPIH